MDKKELSTEYFEVDPGRLISDKPLGFCLYVFLKLNGKIVKVRNKEQTLNETELTNYISKGIKNFYVEKAEQSAFNHYIEKVIQEPLHGIKEFTQEISKINAKDFLDILNDKSLGTQKKGEILQGISKNLLQNLNDLSKGDQAAFNKTYDLCKDAMKEVIEVASDDKNLWHAINDIYNLISAQDKNLATHSSNVSTLSVMFAMGMGYSDKQMLSDIGFAAFMHDIGLTQCSIQILSTPYEKLFGEDLNKYKEHVNIGLELIKKFKPETTELVRTIIEQHHETFAGTGYPKGVIGYELDEPSQIVSFANIIDKLVTGRMTGEKHDLADAFKKIKEMQQGETGAAHLFDPDLFDYLMQVIGV